MEKWEYLRQALPPDVPIAVLDALGDEGWMLAVVVGGFGIFVRSKIKRQLRDQGREQMGQMFFIGNETDAA